MTITAEQRAMRARGIGGSDAPVIAGASPYKTPLALWLEKKGRVPPIKETLPMKIGTALEPTILGEWMQLMGREVHAVGDTLFDMQNPALFAHIDGCVTGALEGVEAKWVGNPSSEWGEPGTDSVPPHVFIQCCHYMMVTGWYRWHVAAALGGREVRPYVIERDERIINRLRDIELEFLERVQGDDPPPIMLPSDVRLLYPKATNDCSVIADDATRGALERLRLVRSERESCESMEDRLTSEIQAFMGEAGALIDGVGAVLATWKSSRPTVRLDSERFKREQPALWIEFSKEGAAARRFLLKGKQETQK